MTMTLHMTAPRRLQVYELDNGKSDGEDHMMAAARVPTNSCGAFSSTPERTSPL